MSHECYGVSNHQQLFVKGMSDYLGVMAFFIQQVLHKPCSYNLYIEISTFPRKDNSMFRLTTQKTSNLHITDSLWGNYTSGPFY